MGQLAGKIRAKFPGAYDDLPDAALEQQVLAKHPEYADLATPADKPAPTTAANEPTTFMGGALRSIGQTAALTGRGVWDGLKATVDPRTYIKAAHDKQADEQRMLEEAQGTRQPSSDYGMANTRALGQTLSTPSGGGQAIGGLVASLVLPRAVGRLQSAAESGGVRLMQSALKPSQSLVNARSGAGFGSKDAIARAVLEEGRNVTAGGLDKAQLALDATDASAQAALKAGAGAGVTVDPFKVTQAIDGQGGQTFGKQINAQPDTAAIAQVRENFANNPHISDPVTGMAPMPADLAHEFSMNTGKNLKGKFGRLGGATVEAEKAGRASITGQLRDQIPELEPLWKQEAQQITTRDALEQALARTGNRDPIGLGTMVGAVKNPALAAVGAMDRSAPIKSLLARGLYNMPAPSPDTMRALLLSLMASHPAEDAQGR